MKVSHPITIKSLLFDILESLFIIRKQLEVLWFICEKLEDIKIELKKGGVKRL